MPEVVFRKSLREVVDFRVLFCAFIEKPFLVGCDVSHHCSIYKLRYYAYANCIATGPELQYISRDIFDIEQYNWKIMKLVDIYGES